MAAESQSSTDTPPHNPLGTLHMRYQSIYRLPLLKTKYLFVDSAQVRPTLCKSLHIF